MDIVADSGESFEQRWTSQFSSQVTPEVQAGDDAWMQKDESESGETVLLEDLKDGSSEKNHTSVAKQIDEILAQIEQEAKAAVPQNSPEPSDPIQTASAATASSQTDEAEESFADLDQSTNATQTSQNQQTVNESISLSEPPMTEEVAADLASSSEAPISQETPTISESEPTTINPIPAQKSQISQEMKAVDQPSTDPTIPAPAMSKEGPKAAKKSTSKQTSGNTSKRSTKTPSKSASQNEETEPPNPSDIDTIKDVYTPEEADPSIKPQTEKAKEAENEDAQQPLGNMPKTPS